MISACTAETISIVSWTPALEMYVYMHVYTCTQVCTPAYACT